jgi:hypothetical protein
MTITNSHDALRAMTVAFKLSISSIGQSDKRRAQKQNTAKVLIFNAENFMTARTGN